MDMPIVGINVRYVPIADIPAKGCQKVAKEICGRLPLKR